MSVSLFATTIVAALGDTTTLVTVLSGAGVPATGDNGSADLLHPTKQVAAAKQTMTMIDRTRIPPP